MVVRKRSVPATSTWISRISRQLDDKEVIARANAQAWNPESDEYISIAKLEYDVKAELGEYPVRFATANGTEHRAEDFCGESAVCKK